MADPNTIGKGDDEWMTPAWFFKELDDEFYFTVDGAASHANALCTRYCTIEGTFQVVGDRDEGTYYAQKISDADGLSYEGEEGDVIFVNPPYSHPLVRQFVEHWSRVGTTLPNRTVVMLLRPFVDTHTFHDFIWDEKNHCPRPGVQVRFRRGRVAFVDPNPEGSQRVQPPSGNMVVVFSAAE